jgi:hypothetical protein
MRNTAIEVITSVQRRRRWGAEEKERLVAGIPGVGGGRLRGRSRSWDSSKSVVWLATSVVRTSAAGVGFCAGADCGRRHAGRSVFS